MAWSDGIPGRSVFSSGSHQIGQENRIGRLTWGCWDKAALEPRQAALLEEICGAREGSPWPHETTRLNRVIFPQMSKWLPEEEHAQLCFAFEAEWKRLNLAA
jgi:hypothetical protein